MGEGRRQRRVIFVNRFFWPDHSATSQILSDVAFAMAAKGLSVEVVTSRLSYGDTDIRYPAHEVYQGVTIHRVATTGFGRVGIAGRAVDYLSFYLTALAKALGRMRRGDIVVAKTDPPLLSIPMWLAAWLKGARQVNWLQDLYPEIASLLGMRLFDGWFGRLLARLRTASLKASTMNIVIGEAMRDRMAQEGVAPDILAVVENFTDDDDIHPIARTDHALRSEWGYGPDIFVIGYSGNLGKAHDLSTMLDAARRLQARGVAHVRFLFVGGGALFTDIAAQVEQFGLTNIDCRPYQPRARLSESLTVPDIHWISLRPELEGYLLPSKFYGVLAAGRPLIFIGHGQAELAMLIRQEECGWGFDLGEGAALADQIEELSLQPRLVEAAGHRARGLMDRCFRREIIIGKWLDLIKRLS